MQENVTDALLNLSIRPFRMLALKKCRFMPSHAPIKVMCGAPPLFRAHATENGNLLRRGLFVRQHEQNMLGSVYPGKPRDTSQFW
jgi:hypothetical protein